MVDQVEIHRLVCSRTAENRLLATQLLKEAFPQLLDKSQAWQDLHRLTHDEYSLMRLNAIKVLGMFFNVIPDRAQAWRDLHRLSHDKDHDVHKLAVDTLGKVFIHVPDKAQAWQDLLWLIDDKDRYVRLGAIDALGKAFIHVPDKAQAWQDLHRLTGNKNRYVRKGSADALGALFSVIPEKTQAWQDLHRLTCDRDRYVRKGAANALGTLFNVIPDKTQAWQDLHRLTYDEDSAVRWGAVDALGSSFIHIPDEAQAWQDLHRLTYDWDRYVRWGAVSALGSSFAHIPNKAQAWKDLLSLADDEDSAVREKAVDALGISFAHVPDKAQAWDDIDRLTKDSDPFVRSHSLYSLGRASIFKATETEDDKSFRRYLMEAIYLFEESSKESMFTPAKFCLPFYRSFYFITFRGIEAQYEANRYLCEAKSAIEQSKSKKILFEAVESLSQALINVQKVRGATTQDRQLYLEALRRSCEKAAGLASQADDHTPGAARTIQRGLQIIEQNIRAELAEIEASSSRLLKATRHTPFEPITNRTVERIRGLSEIEYGFNAESIMDDVVPDIRAMCSFLLPKSKESVCELKNWEVLDFEKKVPLFKRAITLCANQMENFSEQIINKEDQIAFLREGVLVRLDTINFHIFKINIRSGNMSQSLNALEYELQKIKKIKDDLDRLGQKPEDLGIHQQLALQELQASTPGLIKELKDIINDREESEDPLRQEVPDSWRLKILNMLRALEESPARTALGWAADLLQVITFLQAYYPITH